MAASCGKIFFPARSSALQLCGGRLQEPGLLRWKLYMQDRLQPSSHYLKRVGMNSFCNGQELSYCRFATSIPLRARKEFKSVRASGLHPEAAAKDAKPGGRRTVQMTESIHEYILSHTREPEVLAKVRKETATMPGSSMQISPEQGQLLYMLAKLMGAEKCIEVGVFAGYSAISVALALPPHGRLVACERVEQSMELARKYFRLAGVEHKIDARLGLAEDTLLALLQNGEAESYDFAFLDADKRSYSIYYELLLQLLRPGGLLVVDNVLWHGDVADPQVTDVRTVALRNFNDFIVMDQRVDMSMVAVGDGVTLCRKR